MMMVMPATAIQRSLFDFYWKMVAITYYVCIHTVGTILLAGNVRQVQPIRLNTRESLDEAWRADANLLFTGCST